jgi:HD-GYP domain-containing protein (c-di-GMP phosphodiesterase class II)/CheY-like chemotaxis protein
MRKILVLEDDPELSERIAFILESVSGILVIRANNRQEAVKEIAAAQGKIDLLIVDYHQAPLTTLTELQEAAAHIDVIFCIQDKRDHTEPPGWKVFATVERNFLASVLLVNVEKWLSAQGGEETADNDPAVTKYCRIKTKLLIDVSPLYSDIYAKLSETKYLKIFQKGDVFDREDLRRYTEQKKIEYVYLRKESCSEFIHKYVSRIEEIARSSKDLPFDEVAYMHTSIQESVQELIEKIGFNEDVQSLAKAQIQLTVKMMGKKPVLKNILKRLEGRKGKYLSDHSFLTGTIACAIASHLEWSSEATFLKLTIAAFMHDVILTDEKVAECESVEQAEALGLSEDAVASFKKHPLKAAELIRQMSEIPSDVDSIVFQHHELPNGNGFPRGINSAHISPLSAIFIIAHEMAKEFFQEREQFVLGLYIEKIKPRYPQALFKKILVAMAELKF